MAGLYHSPRNAPGEWVVDGEYVSRSSLGGLTESPCKNCPDQETCTNRSLLKNPDCPYYQPREPVSCSKEEEKKHSGNRVKKSKANRHECPFDGCERQTTFLVCFQHKHTYDRRIKNGFPMDKIFKSGHVREKKLPEIKYCKHCKQPMKRRDGEAAYRWENRKTCSLSCSGALAHKGRHKLVTKEDYKAIKNSKERTVLLAKKHGLSESTVAKIKSGKYDKRFKK